MFLSIVIPAYNEENTISNTIDELYSYFKKKSFEFEILVVDDGSRDQTVATAESKAHKLPNVRVIRSSRNQGKGGAVKIGALESRGDWQLFLDADLSTQPEEFEKLAPYMNDYDIIIGSRCLPDSVVTIHQPRLREFIGRTLNRAFRIILKLPFADTQCGFKLYHKRTRPLYEAQQLTRWLFEVELLYLALRNNFRVKEAPVRWAHDAASHVKVTDFFDIVRDLYRIKKIHQ